MEFNTPWCPINGSFLASVLIFFDIVRSSIFLEIKTVSSTPCLKGFSTVSSPPTYSNSLQEEHILKHQCLLFQSLFHTGNLSIFKIRTTTNKVTLYHKFFIRHNQALKLFRKTIPNDYSIFKDHKTIRKDVSTGLA